MRMAATRSGRAGRRSSPSATSRSRVARAGADQSRAAQAARCGSAAGSATGFTGRLRAAGASPETAAQYLAALATEIDVGDDIAPGDAFDLVLPVGQRRACSTPGSTAARRARSAAGALERGSAAATGSTPPNADQPDAGRAGLILPAAGRITSYFGNRVHPILRFTRFHAGIDIGAAWGSPIVAAGDGQVVGAGWAGGYGRQVRIAHGGGMSSSYSHMSQIGGRAGQLRPPRPGDRLCRLVGPLDRPAPPFRGPAGRRAGQSAWRPDGQRAGGRPGARKRSRRGWRCCRSRREAR